MHQRAKTSPKRVPEKGDSQRKGICEYKNAAGVTYYRAYAGVSLEGKKIMKSDRDFWKAHEWRREKLLQIENHGRKRLDVSDELIGKAQRLETFCQERGGSLEAAVAFWDRHNNPQEGAITLSALVAQYMADPVEASGWRPKHRKHLQSLYGHFKDDFGLRPSHDIRPKEITKWILEPKCWGTERVFKKWSEKTMKNVKNSLSALFEFAVRGKHLVKNPCSEVRLPEVPKTAIRVLTLEECADLLRLAWSTRETAGFLPYTVLCLFAGLRPSEACRVTWSDIRLESCEPTIRVEEHKDGINVERHVDIHPTMTQWLMLCRPESQPGSSILPPSCARARDPFESALKRFRRLREKAEISNWGRDPMRHSFASYLYCLRKDVGNLRAQLGHENGSPVTLRHYLNRSIVPEIGRKFWELTPRAVLGADSVDKK
jgi:integrase